MNSHFDSHNGGRDSNATINQNKGFGGRNFGRSPGRGRSGGRTFNNNQFQNGGRQGRGRGHGRGRAGRFDNTDHDLKLDAIEQIGTPSDNTVSIAIEGCCHGELDRIYDRIAKHVEETGQKIDLLLCCGDFQSVRNFADFHSMAVPPKFRSLGTFHQYYSGAKVAPILTIFIGGNHEASQPLQELYYGGWVAPNIYYLGAAGVVRYKGVRICGISGIYKSHDYNMGRFETPPYDNSTMRSAYHVRNLDVYRLKCLSNTLQDDLFPIDIMISHDWPQGIEQYGDTASLLRKKPFFCQEVQDNNLGSPPNRELLVNLKPRYWFAAHLHVKFKAVMEHTTKEQGAGKSSLKNYLVPSQLIGQSIQPRSPCENQSASEQAVSNTEFHGMEARADVCKGPDLTTQMTQFLSLDKCLPRRQYLSIAHIPMSTPGGEGNLEYDVEWLAILYKTKHLQTSERKRINLPQEELESVTPDDLISIRGKFGGSMIIPSNFRQTAQPHTSTSTTLPNRLPPPLQIMGNPQTDEFIQKLQIEHVVTIPWSNPLTKPQSLLVTDNNEIDIDEDDVPLQYTKSSDDTDALTKPQSLIVTDNNEIDIDEDDVPLQFTKSGDATDALTKPQSLIVTDNNEIDIDEDDALLQSAKGSDDTDGVGINLLNDTSLNEREGCKKPKLSVE